MKKIILIVSLFLLVTVFSFFNTIWSISRQQRNTKVEIKEDEESNELLIKYKPKNGEKVSIMILKKCNSSSFLKDINQNKTKQKLEYDYLQKYPQILTCKNKYNEWQKGAKIEPADKEFNEKLERLES